MGGFELIDPEMKARIKVIGVGGAGGNAVNNLIDINLTGVKFIAANTDSQDLAASKAQTKIQLGPKLTEGLGAGSKPEVGKEAAIESRDVLKEALAESDMVFIAAGLGGGTGTGASPIVADICQELDILTVAVVTKPFSFEGKQRVKIAEDGLEELKQKAHTVITIPNDRLRGLSRRSTGFFDCFKTADEVLVNSVKGIADLIMGNGVVNCDFADVKTIMSHRGQAIMGIGVSSGENRAIEAVEKAISHPLLEDTALKGAMGAILHITASADVTMDEIAAISDRIHDEIANEKALIIWGVNRDDDMGDNIRVTVIATGIGGKTDLKQPEPRGIRGVVSRSAPRKYQEITRGTVRDVVPEDITRQQDLESPAYIRVDKKASAQKGKKPAAKKKPSFMDLDTPTFMRRGAD